MFNHTLHIFHSQSRCPRSLMVPLKDTFQQHFDLDRSSVSLVLEFKKYFPFTFTLLRSYSIFENPKGSYSVLSHNSNYLLIQNILGNRFFPRYLASFVTRSFFVLLRILSFSMLSFFRRTLSISIRKNDSQHTICLRISVLLPRVFRSGGDLVSAPTRNRL